MIDYSNISKSILYYEGLGYQRIESPWTVTEDISRITKPQEKEDYKISNKKKVLVASGEQSFLYLYLKGFLPKGKFQTVTPCFRDEVFDTFHTKYFMKNELIVTDFVDQNTLVQAMYDAKHFYDDVLGRSVDIVSTREGFDLVYKGIELGSYGIRHCDFLSWIYATGCPEPRLSQVKYMINNGRLPLA